MPTLEDKVSEVLAKMGIRPRHSARPDDDDEEDGLTPGEPLRVGYATLRAAGPDPETDARLKAIEKANADLKAENEKLAAQVATQQEAERQASLAAHKESVERWKLESVAGFKLTPAAADKAEALAIEHPAAFGALREIFATNPAIKALSGGKSGEDARAESGEPGNYAADANRLTNLAKAYAKEHGVTFRQAMDEVSREHPELCVSAPGPAVYDTDEE